jgi:hypothetical protein
LGAAVLADEEEVVVHIDLLAVHVRGSRVVPPHQAARRVAAGSGEGRQRALVNTPSRRTSIGYMPPNRQNFSLETCAIKNAVKVWHPTAYLCGNGAGKLMQSSADSSPPAVARAANCRSSVSGTFPKLLHGTYPPPTCIKVWAAAQVQQ